MVVVVRRSSARTEDKKFTGEMFIFLRCDSSGTASVVGVGWGTAQPEENDNRAPTTAPPVALASNRSKKAQRRRTKSFFVFFKLIICGYSIIIDKKI